MPHGGGGQLTLVFKLGALERLADPAAAFGDAEQWTAVLGLVSDDAPERLSRAADRLNVSPDVLSAAGGQTGGLAVIRQQYPSDRHVFVGTSDEDRRLAESLGWEYLAVEDAAEAADWPLADADDRWRHRSDENGE